MTETFNKLYLHELELIASAEDHMIRLLSRLAPATDEPELRRALEKQQSACQDQRDMVRNLLRDSGHRSRVPLGSGMQALAEECLVLLKEFPNGNLRDAVIIAHMQRAEHYMMAAYASVRDYAKLLGDKVAAEALEQASKATTAISKDLGAIAIQVNAEAYVDTREEET